MSPPRVPLLTIATVIQGGRHSLSGKHFVPENEGYPAYGAGGLNGYLDTYEFEQPAVVLSSIGARCGKCFLATGLWSSLANTQVILPHPDKVEARYLWYQLNDEGSWLRSGTAQPFIKPSTVKARAVLLPPLPEQRRIAAMLDKADAIRHKRQQALQLTEDLLRSAFLEMFGDPVANPRGWDSDLLAKRLTFLTSGSRGWAKYYSKSGRFFLRIQNVGCNRLLLDDVAFVEPPDNAEARRTLARPGDVLLSITADLGRTAVVPEGLGPAHINQHLALLRPRGLEPLYLSAFLASDGGQAQLLRLNRQGVKAGLNFDDIKSLRVLVPPRALQQSYAGFQRSLEKLEARYADVATEAGHFFNSLVQCAFRGEL